MVPVTWGMSGCSRIPRSDATRAVAAVSVGAFRWRRSERDTMVSANRCPSKWRVSATMVRLMLVRSAHPSDADGCVNVLALLPEYFTASTHHEVRRGISDHMALVADVDGTVVGFVLIERRHRRSAEVLYIAVHPAFRNQGIGSLVL